MENHVAFPQLVEDFTLRFYQKTNPHYSYWYERNYKMFYRWFSMFKDTFQTKVIHTRIFVPFELYTKMMGIERLKTAYHRAKVSRRTLFNWMNKKEIEYVCPAGDRFIVSISLDRKLQQIEARKHHKALVQQHVLQKRVFKTSQIEKWKAEGLLDDDNKVYLNEHAQFGVFDLFIKDVCILRDLKWTELSVAFENRIIDAPASMYSHEIVLNPRVVLFKLIESKLISFI